MKHIGTHPRIERLQEEFGRMKKLADESDLMQIDGLIGTPPEKYKLIFKGKSLMLQGDQVGEIDQHVAIIDLGADWPQQPPLILWQTPIFHPNIRMPYVCVLGRPYSASTHLDQICETLWDMLTYKTYNVDNAFDKKAAQWVSAHPKRFPLDDRELRNKTVVIRVKGSFKTPKEEVN